MVKTKRNEPMKDKKMTLRRKNLVNALRHSMGILAGFGDVLKKEGAETVDETLNEIVVALVDIGEMQREEN